MKKEDIIQSVLQGIMSGGPSSRMKKKAKDAQKKKMSKEEEEILEDAPTIIKISVMEPIGVEKMEKDDDDYDDDKPSSIMEKLKRKAKRK